MPQTYTVAEACARLGIDQKTFRRWRAKAGVEPDKDAIDGRLRRFTRPQLVELAKQHGRTLAEDGEAPVAPAQGRATIRALRERLDELEGRIAVLERRQGIRRPTANTPGGQANASFGEAVSLYPSPDAENADGLPASDAQAFGGGVRWRPPAPRRRRSGEPRELPGPGLPEGWISFNRWCEGHDINHQAAQQEIGKGQMPSAERGEWWERPQGPTRNAYSSDQHITASRFAALRWPARFQACEICRPHLASLPGRPETPTVPVAARLERR
jgi:DNA-binding transcriptional MerR regulator